MKKSELRVIRKDDKIIIRKAVDALTIIVMILPVIIFLLVAIFSNNDSQYAWILLAIFVGYDIFLLVDLIFCKIVIDICKRELCVCDLYPEKCHWEDIQSFKTFYKSGDYESGDIYKFLVVLKSDHIIDFRTSGSAQSQELVDLLQSTISLDK